MSFDLRLIDQAAEQIRQQIRNGEIVESCCMSGLPSPVTESWEAARELTEKESLTDAQQQAVLDALKPAMRKQLKSTGFDDFDLIYERLLQLIRLSA